MEGFVYIIQSTKTGRYYIGSTTDIDRRLYDHNHKNTPSTKSGVPWILKFLCKYDSLCLAREVERRLKKQKSKIFLEDIIAKGIVK